VQISYPYTSNTVYIKYLMDVLSGESLISFRVCNWPLDILKITLIMSCYLYVAPPQIKALHQLSFSLSQNNETSPQCFRHYNKGFTFRTPITLYASPGVHNLSLSLFRKRVCKWQKFGKKRVRFLDNKLQTEFTF
jgi:hypothetical protein